MYHHRGTAGGPAFDFGFLSNKLIVGGPSFQNRTSTGCSFASADWRPTLRLRSGRAVSKSARRGASGIWLVRKKSRSRAKSKAAGGGARSTRKVRERRGSHGVGHASEIKSLGHTPSHVSKSARRGAPGEWSPNWLRWRLPGGPLLEMREKWGTPTKGCDETPIPFVMNSHPCKKRKGGAASVSNGCPAPTFREYFP
jgi:hypothetical protein